MTPTNETGHGLPELPEPYKKGRREIPGAGKFDVDCGAGPDLYTAGQVQQYAIDYAAALALSRGVPDGLKRYDHEVVGTYSHWEVRAHESPNGEWVRYADAWLAMFAAAPAAAGAQGEDETASDGDNCDDCQIHRQAHHTIDNIVMGAGVFEVLHEGGVEPAWMNTIDAVKKLATPQPAAADGGVRERAMGLLAAAAGHWHDLYRKECRLRQDDAARYGQQIVDLEAALSSHRQAGDDRPHVVRIPNEKRWVEGDSELLKWHADGYNSALSDVMSVNQGVSRLEPSEHPSQDGLRKLLPDLIDYAESGKVAEPWMVDKMRAELESLLALVEKGAGNGR